MDLAAFRKKLRMPERPPPAPEPKRHCKPGKRVGGRHQLCDCGHERADHAEKGELVSDRGMMIRQGECRHCSCNRFQGTRTTQCEYCGNMVFKHGFLPEQHCNDCYLVTGVCPDCNDEHGPGEACSKKDRVWALKTCEACGREMSVSAFADDDHLCIKCAMEKRAGGPDAGMLEEA